KYYDCFFDPLHPGAVEEFIRLTHEPYARAVGEHFGSTIPGIFTDETEPPHWSPHIEAELGLDLSLLLPALRHEDHPRAAEVRYRLRQCALKLFSERWEKPIAQWCADHNLIWGAEKPTWRPAQFAGVAQPSTDAGHRRVGWPPETLGGGDLRANHRAAIAAAEQSGREEVRCECFHSLGWGATLQDQKWQIDWLTVQGVNRFTPHAFYATSSGLAKHDAAPSFFAENPYWTHFHHLSEYTARLSLAMSSGRERARVALLHPTESLWIGTPDSRYAREEYEWLMNELIAQHHIFHPVDALALLEARAVEGALELGHVRYETLLIPPLCALGADTENAVRAALAAGMTVIMAPPFGDAAPPLAGAVEMAGWPGIIAIENRADWMKLLERNRPLSIADENGAQIRTVWALWREAGAQQLLFVANTADFPVMAHLEVEAEVAGWENWALESGDSSPISAQIEAGRSRITLEMPPLGSALLVSVENAAPTPVAAPAAPARVLATDGLWELSLDRPNALRLNRWRLACDGGDWADPTLDDGSLREVEALPLKFRDQVTRQWVEACPRVGQTEVWYRRAVNCEFVPDDLAILVENGAILGEWTLFINGHEVPRSDFAPASYHGDDKISAAVSRLFRLGENCLALRVAAAPEMGGLRTPLHLIGSFALGGEARRTVGAMPQQAPFHDLVAAGLPHFSGAATYRREMARAELGAVVAIPQGFGDIAQLRVNGESLGVRPWSPYTWEVPAGDAEMVLVELTVVNTLLSFLEGQEWDVSAQTVRSV
ncbi:MAG: hypothetical protein KY445_14480, partial [Armatimonadetes bacterium]|nr:hypothetical protein [Armatimonadota bacterium]